MGRGVLAIAIACAAGCAFAPPDPPTAVIDLSPATLCAPDDYATTITVSGARSSARLSLVPTPPTADALSFRWRIEGAAYEIASGDLDAPELTLRTIGDRPLHAWLTVRDEAGGEAVSNQSLFIVETNRDCTLGCPRTMTCGADGRCVPEAACTLDADCGACFVCADTHCVAGVSP